MEPTYTQAQLVSFGKYLLNTTRVQDAMEHARVGSDGELDTEFIIQVYDADLANWSESQNIPYDPNGDVRDNSIYKWMLTTNTGEPLHIHQGNVESNDNQG